MNTTSRRLSGAERGFEVARILPALWGLDAYNDGAGMNQVKKMAAFVIRNMLQNNP
jgi:cytochrome c